VFEAVASTKGRVFVLGAGGDLLLANAEKDGLVNLTPSFAFALNVTLGDGQTTNHPMSFVCEVTDAGLEFVERYMQGVALA
jgi:hypothetical protein